MSQTTVLDEPLTFFEGLAAQNLLADSYIASGQVLVAKACGSAPTDIDPFGTPLLTGAKECQALDATNSNFVGISMHDNTKETPDGATYLAYQDSDTVPVLRRGRIWVFSADAVDDLTKGVWARNATEGALPDAALGTFRATTAADHVQLTNVRWLAGAVVGGRNFGFLEINL